MPITFQSKTHASITMMNEVALKLLRMMGHSGTVPGAIRAEDLQPALDKLKEKITTLAKEEDESGNNVSLKTRSFPLIDLLQHGIRENEHVMWDYY